MGDTGQHQSYLVCLGLSLLAGLSTTIGAVVVMLVPGSKIPPDKMAFILAFAAGVMFSTSFLEFWVPALVGGGIGDVFQTVFFSGLGVACFLAFSRLVPEPTLVDKESPRPARDVESPNDTDNSDLFRQRSTPVSNMIGRREEDPENPLDTDNLNILALPSHTVGNLIGNPQCAVATSTRSPRDDSPVDHRWRLAAIMMLSLTVHNFPEGMAVAISSFEDQHLGLVVMTAISIHNVPEGIAISIPVLNATGSRWKAVWMTLLSGFAEPLGACLALVLTTFNGAPSTETMRRLLCAVGGIMSAVSFKELVPESLRFQRFYSTVVGFVFGMAVMFTTHVMGA